MDFLDPAKKRQHKRRLMVGYFLVSLIIILVAYLSLLLSFSYGYDIKTGKIIQNGLVYVSSHPTSADVYVNNEFKGNTNLKLNIPAGNYDFVLKSKGYRDWYSTINLEGGGVSRLTYPLLVPQKLVSADTQPYAKNPTFASDSPNRHWLVVLQPDSVTKFDVYDLSKKVPTRTVINLPTTVLKPVTGPQTIRAVEWSSDNQHLLIEHDFKGGKEFIVMDRLDASKAYNVNSLLTTAPDSVVLRNKHFDQLYAHIAKTKSLLSINAFSKHVNTVLTDVIEFKANGVDTILYTSNQSKVAGKIAVNIWDGQKSYLLHNYPANTIYKLDMSSYSGDTYVAVSPQVSNKLYIFKDPLTIMKAGKIPNPFIALKTNNPQFISFSDSGQFVIAQSGSSFSAYDFDADLWHYFTLKDNVGLTTKAVWMDNYRLSLNINNNINIFDFNGVNQQVLSASLTGFVGYFDGNYARLFTLSQSVKQPAKPALVSTSMVIH